MKKALLTIAMVTILFNMYGNYIIYVNHSATGSADGSSWANAYTNLDSALVNSTAIDNKIWIAKGTYKPGDGTNRTAWFNLTCHVYGGFAGNETTLEERDIAANPTILSGDLLGNDNGKLETTDPLRADNSFTVCYYRGRGLSGVIIEGGNANSTSFYGSKGAGMFASGNFNAKITDCIFRNNSAKTDAAIHFYRPKGLNSWLTINRCKFVKNVSGTGIVGFSTNGSHGTYLSIYNSLIHHNKVTGDESQLFPMVLTNHGSTIRGALHFEFVHNTITENTYPANGATIGYANIGESGQSFHNIIMHNNIFADDIYPFKEISGTQNVSTSALHFNYNVYAYDYLFPIDSDSEQKYYNSNHFVLSYFKNPITFDYRLKNCKSNGHSVGSYFSDNHASQYDMDGNTRDSFIQDAGCYMIMGIPKYNIVRSTNNLAIPSTRSGGFWFVDTTKGKIAFVKQGTTITPHREGIYKVVSKDTATKCHSVSNEINFYYVSNHTIEKNAIVFYPNPTTNYINISSEWNGSELQIHSMNGKLIKKETVFSNKSITLIDIPNGTYLVTLHKDNAITRIKMIKH